MKFTFDLFQTLALSVAALTLGSFIRKKVSFFERYCIPSPVIGGLVFAILSCILYTAGLIEFSFDDTMRDACMVFFFTCVGFQADLKTLRTGGKPLALFSLAIAALIILQNTLAIGMSKLLHISPLFGLCTGSVALVGGHGTSGAFGPVLEKAGFTGASSFCIASATYGLIAGGLLGGPIGNALIRRKKLHESVPAEMGPAVQKKGSRASHAHQYAPALFQLIAAAGIGTVVSRALSGMGMTFPVYIGAMIVAILMRNLSEHTDRFTVHMEEITDMSGIFLNLFLGIAMISLKLWQLAELAVPMIILLAVQTVFMGLYALFPVFYLLGHDYDAAVISAGICGLGLGATPTAMANMQSVCRRYGPSVKAFLIVPIVGGVILDLLNSILITFFINIV